MTNTTAHHHGQERGVSGLAIAALVLGLLGFLLLPIPIAFVLGLIALLRIVRSPATTQAADPGTPPPSDPAPTEALTPATPPTTEAPTPPTASGSTTARTVGVIFSLVGIVAAGVWSLGWTAAIALVHERAESGPYALQDLNQPVSDTDPAISAETEQDTSADLCEPSPGYATICTLQAGDCFTDPEGSEFYEIELIPCDEPHNAQVIGSYSPSSGDWPGWSSFLGDVDTTCQPMSESALDPERKPDGFFIGYLAPDEQAWDSGIQEALCYVSTGGEPWTTSLM